jgi:pimeloyl-ACP methyl ester carboxylesterase
MMQLNQHIFAWLLRMAVAFATVLAVYFLRDMIASRMKDEEKMPETRYVALPDQGQIAYGIYGSQHAPKSVFYFHGSPSSHHEAFLLFEAGRRHNIRIIAASRPGSGGSTFRERGALLDYPNDILALADHLTINTFSIIAVSGGAPYAFACRRRIPRSRLMGMGIVAGIYPVASLGTAGMKLPSRVMLWVASWFPGIVAWLIDKQLGTVARDEGEKKMEAMLVAGMQHASTPQSEKLAWDTANPEVRRAVVTSICEGVKYGGRGPAWEMKLLGSHWGFELADVQPVEEGELVMWHGDLDTNVPLAMAKKAAAQLGSRAELRIVEGQGHGTLTFHKADEIIRTVKGMLGG